MNSIPDHIRRANSITASAQEKLAVLRPDMMQLPDDDLNPARGVWNGWWLSVIGWAFGAFLVWVFWSITT